MHKLAFLREVLKETCIISLKCVKCTRAVKMSPLLGKPFTTLNIRHHQHSTLSVFDNLYSTITLVFKEAVFLSYFRFLFCKFPIPSLCVISRYQNFVDTVHCNYFLSMCSLSFNFTYGVFSWTKNCFSICRFSNDQWFAIQS